MTFKEIQELVKMINKLELSEFKLKQGDLELTVRTKRYSKSVENGGEPRHIYTSIPQPALPQAAPSAPAAPAASAPAAPAETPAESDKGLLEIKSPIVGTFYRSASPEKPPYVKVGDSIEKGAVVCIVEAMKLFNEIESEISGKIVKVMVEDASPVEYDQVLFLVDPKG